jgi:2-methylaconitate cis-trans-isomerase PrpF
MLATIVRQAALIPRTIYPAAHEMVTILTPQLTLAPQMDLPKTLRRRKARLPAIWMRSGTSKGLFLHKKHLPLRQEEWSPIILAAMGSQDSDAKQLDGIGGAKSTTSKVAVIAPSDQPGIDVEYTFIQVPVGSARLDFSGNCGNIASGVGPFAIDEGLVVVPPGQTTTEVRILNTNTGCIIRETIEVDNSGKFVEDGDYLTPGTRSKGSKILIAFENPAGSLTGRLLPSGNPTDTLVIPTGFHTPPCNVRVSAVDAANPFIFVDGSSMPPEIWKQGAHAAQCLDFLEAVRRQGAVLMGLATSIESAAQVRGTPKIAVVHAAHGGEEDQDAIKITALSMGKVHDSIQLTGAVCLSAAACIPGTIASIKGKLSDTDVRPCFERRDSPFMEEDEQRWKICIKHPSGEIKAEIVMAEGTVKSVTVARTARRLFEGSVCYLK